MTLRTAPCLLPVQEACTGLCEVGLYSTDGFEERGLSVLEVSQLQDRVGNSYGWTRMLGPYPTTSQSMQLTP